MEAKGYSPDDPRPRRGEHEARARSTRRRIAAQRATSLAATSAQGLERDGLVERTPERHRDIIDESREAGRASATLADACGPSS